jgi:hypothetical protein
MNDRELLEMAAKAAGRAIRWDGAVAVLMDYEPGIDGCSAWNPLTGDGDALRLAVKLELGIEVMLSLNETRAGDGDQEVVREKHGDDPYAATRRAIVRAAAAIGGVVEAQPES